MRKYYSQPQIISSDELDSEDFARFLMAKDRKNWQDPKRIVDDLKISEGSTVADLACGPGFFTMPLSTKVGRKGKVYAVDSNPVMIRHLRENLRSLGENEIQNVTVLERDVSETTIPAGSVDTVLFANVLHDLHDKRPFLNEVKRIAKPDAQIVDIDWHARQMETGPPMKIRLSEDDSRRILRENGFIVVRAFDAGPYHYGFVLNKKSAGGEI